MTSRSFPLGSSVVVLTAICLIVSACRGSFGYEAGEYDTLADDVAAQRAEMEATLSIALGPHELIGERVRISPCEPLSEYSSGTRLVIRPEAMGIVDGIAAIVESLEAQGVSVEAFPPVGPSQVSESYGGDYLGFGGFSLWRALEPEPAIVFGVSSGCYAEGRIGVDNPHDLSYNEGVTILTQE